MVHSDYEVSRINIAISPFVHREETKQYSIRNLSIGFQLTDQQHRGFSRTCQSVHRRSQLATVNRLR